MSEEKLDLAEKPEDVFAGMFQIYLPRFRMLTSKMSSRMLKRMVVALIEAPLNEKEYNPRDVLEREAFVLGDKLLQAKFFMMMHTLAEQQQQAEQAAASVEEKPAEEKQINV
jgi:hypothetical protein